ncbi:hypothetical protein AB0J89_22345 [Micromonospora chokoriensis]
MADRRGQLASLVRDTLAEALGATRTRLSAAQAELTAGRERLTRVQRAAAAVPARVGRGVLEEVVAEKRLCPPADAPTPPRWQ